MLQALLFINLKNGGAELVDFVAICKSFWESNHFVTLESFYLCPSKIAD